MKYYLIKNTLSGKVLGTYLAGSKLGAFFQMAKESGQLVSDIEASLKPGEIDISPLYQPEDTSSLPTTQKTKLC